MCRNPWTVDDEALARKCLAEGLDEAEFVARVGRTRQAAHTHFTYLKRKATGYQEPRRYKRKGDGMKAFSFNRPAEELFAAARERLISPRSLTSHLMGDPPAGYSALDKRGN